MPRLVAAAASGLLLALCLPKPGLSPLAWIALLPLLRLWNESAPKGAFGLGWTAGFAFHGLAFYWVYSTCRFAGIAAPLAFGAWFLLCAFLALHWGLIGAAGSALARPLHPLLRPWAWAAVWTGLSAAWGWWTPRLAGDLLAYTQWRFDALIQIGAVLGPYGLDFLIVAWNAALAQAWEEAQGGEPRASARLGVALAAKLVGLAWVYGVVSLTERSWRESGESRRVEILQPAIDQYQKWDWQWQRRIADNFEELLALPRAENPALVVWPETAIPRRVPDDEPAGEAAGWSRRLGAHQLVGVVSETRAGLSYNALQLLGPEGDLRGSYKKREIVPFGEYIPFERQLAFLQRFIGILNQLGGLEAGAAEQPLLETPLGPAAGSICYEAVFPRWARRDAARGARLIVNVTNDGWYKDTWGPHQHFHANRFRAIENRVRVIRSGNTGISGVIDPWGVVLTRLDLERRGRLDARVAAEDPFPERSLYARRGDWFGALNLAAVGLLVLAALRRS